MLTHATLGYVKELGVLSSSVPRLRIFHFLSICKNIDPPIDILGYTLLVAQYLIALSSLTST